MQRFSQIMSQISDVKNNLETINKLSKTSSAFNDTHLKITKLSGIIDSSLKGIDKQISLIRDRECKNLNNYQSKMVKNTSDALNIKLENLSISYQKFLKTQGELIRTIEKRKSNLLGNDKKIKHVNLYNKLSTEDLDDNPNEGLKETIQLNRNDLYSERNSAVQGIEKAMTELSSMFNRISQMIYRQGEMIERIDNETAISLDNINKTQDEVFKLKDDVKSNRALILKVFGIIIAFLVLYIIFIS